MEEGGERDFFFSFKGLFIHLREREQWEGAEEEVERILSNSVLSVEPDVGLYFRTPR